MDSFYWLAKSALHWIEGSQHEAEDAWNRGYVLSLQLPKSGSSEFDRDTFLELRQAMNEPVEDVSVAHDRAVLDPVVSGAILASPL